MDTLQKLQLLSDASQYDLACACGTNNLDRRHRGLDGKWLYPVSLPSGGSSIMFKTLISNVCSNDCKYCPYRTMVDVPRCSMQPEEIARIFMDYVSKIKLIGIFLSSGVVGTPDNTMTLLTDTARILRKQHKYKGYIHLKIIPGASDSAIADAVALASGVSLNIEAPGAKHVAQLSARKNFETDIIRPLKTISRLTEKGALRNRVKQTTQFIVGASDEIDSEIVKYMYGLYDRLGINRIYFSAYQQGLGDKTIPGERVIRQNPDDHFVREHRLYQVDFLLRQYNFKESEIGFDNTGNLSLDKDPKLIWAERHPEHFPIYINRAEKYDLLRVPGIGPQLAQRIVQRRRGSRFVNLDDLPLNTKKLSAVRQYLAV